MKSVSYDDEKKWERLQRMRKASKKKSVRDKVDEELELLEKWESAAEANRKYDRARKAAARRAAERNRQRDAGERNDGRRERESYRSASGQQMHYSLGL